MKNLSITTRLVLSYVTVTVLAVGLVGVLALSLVENYIQAETKAQLAENALAVARQASGLMRPSPQLAELNDLVRSVSYLGQVRVRILDERYKLVIDSGQPEQSSSVVWIQPEPGQNGSLSYIIPVAPGYLERERQTKWMRENFTRLPSVIVRVDESPWGRKMAFQAIFGEEAVSPTPESSGESGTTGWRALQGASVLIPIGEGSRPLGFVQLDKSNSTGTEILAAMRRSLLLAGLGASLIAVIAGLWMSRSLTAPIQALAQSAARMSSGDLAARAQTGGAGEIGQLARQFNLMADHLQASFTTLAAERDALRRFIADASHELRTPITALSSFIELLQGPAAKDSAAREEFLAESAGQVRRLEWITRNLLDLSRFDAGLIQLDRRQVDLGDLLRSAAAPFQQRAQVQNIRLLITVPDQPVSVSADRARMEMALGNLLDNALKFSPAGSQITLQGTTQGGQAQICIADEGCGIPPEDMPHIFERFYRGKTSQGGSGLGLAIAHSIIQAHGGTIKAESQPGQGSRFIIALENIPSQAFLPVQAQIDGTEGPTGDGLPGQKS